MVLLNWSEKCKLLLLKFSLMVQTKRNQEKVVITKICLYGSAKIEQKIKCVMENKGSVAKVIKIQIAHGINILLEHKSIDCLDHFKSYMWTKMYMYTCVCMFTYTWYIWTEAHTYVQKHENFHMCMHMGTSVVLMSTNAPRHMCIC